MRILIDECLPRELTVALVGHDVKTVPQEGWAGLKNGRLLKTISGRFEVFITVVTSGSEVFHQFTERIGQRIPDLAGQVRVHGCSFGTAMTERVLNQTQMNARFHQMCCVRMTTIPHAE